MHSNRKATSWRPGSTNFRVAANESTFYRAFFSRSCLLCSTSSTGAPTCSESFTRKKHRNRTTNKRTRKRFLLWEVFPVGTRPVDANRNSKRFQGIKKEELQWQRLPREGFQWWTRISMMNQSDPGRWFFFPRKLREIVQTRIQIRMRTRIQMRTQEPFSIWTDFRCFLLLVETQHCFLSHQLT